MSTKVITGKNTRWLYAHVWEPVAFRGDSGEPRYRYSVSLLIPKSDQVTMDRIEDAIREAYENGRDVLKGSGDVVPPLDDTLKTPLHDGDLEKPDDSVYAGCWYLSANSVSAPGIVDAGCRSIIDREEVYSGVYGRASITFYAYNYMNTNIGIACGLNNLQKIKDGERLSNRASAAEDFGSVEDENDDDFLD